MSLVYQVKQQLDDLGIRRDIKDDVADLGVELTVCQIVVVVLSMASVVFMFVPLLISQDLTFVLIFFGISSLILVAGMWFWVKRAEICEAPHEYRE